MKSPQSRGSLRKGEGPKKGLRIHVRERKGLTPKRIEKLISIPTQRRRENYKLRQDWGVYGKDSRGRSVIKKRKSKGFPSKGEQTEAGKSHKGWKDILLRASTAICIIRGKNRFIINFEEGGKGVGVQRGQGSREANPR